MELEKLIKEQRRAFETHEPPVGHRKRFEQKLVGQQAKSYQGVWYSAVAVVVLLVLILNGADWLTDTKTKQKMANSGLNRSSQTAAIDIQEIEAFYEYKIQKDKEVAVGAVADDKGDSLLNEHLAKLDKNYALLKIELQRMPNNDRILKRMVENYRMRLKLLERHVNQLAKNKKKHRYEKS